MEKWFVHFILFKSIFRLGPALKELETTERLSDCRFIIEDADGSKKVFNCHKWIFSNASTVFERMFFGDFLESKSNEVVLKNVQPDIFAIFREYLYNYDIKLLQGCDENTLVALVKFAQQYLVSSVTEECIKTLCDRTSKANIVLLIQLYQFGNDILREDLVEEAWENITSRFPESVNHFAIYELSSDVFFKYLEMSKGTLREAMRFYMLETYLKLNGFDISKVISKLSDDIDLKTTDANDEEDKDLEHDQVENELGKGNENDLNQGNAKEVDNKTETKTNVPNEDNKETIQNVQFKNVKNSYIKNLLELVDYTKMTASEFFDGPGKSKYFNLQHKYDIMYAIALQYENN